MPAWCVQKEELVPFYVRRALEGYPACTPIAGLSAGVDAVMRELQSGSPVVLLTLHGVAKRAAALLKDGSKMEQNPQAGLDLVRLLAQMLLVVEFQFLPDALITTGGVVLGCNNSDVQLSACNCVYEVLMASDDYTRKAKCAQWYQHLAADCAQRSGERLGSGSVLHMLLTASESASMVDFARCTIYMAAWSREVYR